MLVVGISPFHFKSTGSVPDWEPKIPHVMQCRQCKLIHKKIKKKNTLKNRGKYLESWLVQRKLTEMKDWDNVSLKTVVCSERQGSTVYREAGNSLLSALCIWTTRVHQTWCPSANGLAIIWLHHFCPLILHLS